MPAPPSRRTAPRSPLPGVSGALLLLPLLAGCSGTPFGEALSRSFPPPAAGEAPRATPAATPVDSRNGPAGRPPAAPAGPAGPGAQSAPAAPPGGSAAVPAPTATAASRPAASTAAAVDPGAAPAAAPAAGNSTSSSRPGTGTAPYRVTIRLPLADPSAPAEVVTEALRRAGVPFEVETIERMAGGPSAPVVRPAPPPR